ncbi:hypothetical protein AURDEDRAFT_172357 [Auricularia subglabra TFB-10046 SS5]|nr:hypothetical protein AURDEDRAFT_172357 [Auricularia subglabra TFB-10046 SS5]
MCIPRILRRLVKAFYRRVKFAILGRSPSTYNIFMAWHARLIVEQSPDITWPELRARVLSNFHDFKKLPKELQRRKTRRFARDIGLGKRARLAMALDEWIR